MSARTRAGRVAPTGGTPAGSGPGGGGERRGESAGRRDAVCGSQECRERERIIFGWAFRLPTDRLMRWEHLGVPWVARHQQVVNLGRGDADRGGLTRRSV